MSEKREVTLRFLAQPSDVNFGGKVHGGAVMKWIDQAGFACAAGWSACYCVTVYVGGIRFLKPILIGNLVEVRAKVIYTGNTSMHVAIDVHARDIKSDSDVQTTHCVIVFVAMGEDGKPCAINAWQPQSEEDLALWDYARKLMNMREGIEAEMAKFIEH